jgi:hypothetical protein
MAANWRSIGILPSFFVMTIFHRDEEEITGKGYLFYLRETFFGNSQGLFFDSI